MIIPPPLPAFTLSPDIDSLTAEQARVLDSCLSSLTGRVGAVMVVSTRTTATHTVIELDTTLGTLVVMERLETAMRRAAQRSSETPAP